MEKQVFTVNNMNCGGCVTNIQQALEADQRVSTINIELSKKQVSVTGDLSAEETATIIRDAGYDAEIGARKSGFLSKLFQG